MPGGADHPMAGGGDAIGLAQAAQCAQGYAMHLTASTLDDLLDGVFKKLLRSKVRVSSSKGSNVEISGAILELRQPRARLSRSHSKGHLFSCLGELFWYISCSNRIDWIEYYIPDYGELAPAEGDGTVWGAYGPRIFGDSPSQYEIVRDLILRKPSTRQAVIQIFDKSDLHPARKDTPCTCSLQFLVRDGLLHLICHMRSNDAFIGLPHDVFAFTMLQEILAREIGVAVGTYKHLVGSLHLYDDEREKVTKYLDEGLQRTLEMPAMPAGSQWGYIKRLFKIEADLRLKGRDALNSAKEDMKALDPYWADMGRLFAIYALTKGRSEMPRADLREVASFKSGMNTQFFNTYIRKRTEKLAKAAAALDLLDSAGAVS